MPPIQSTKSLTGHSLGAAGVQEAIYSLLMMQDGFIAESANIDELDPGIRRRADRAQAHRQRQARHRDVELLRLRRHQRDARLPALQRMRDQMTGMMKGKRGLIMGVANDHSIAWGIAKALAGAGRGARLHLSGRGARQARQAAGRRASAPNSCCPATSRTSPRSTPSSRHQGATGAGSISSSMPSPSPTRTS